MSNLDVKITDETISQMVEIRDSLVNTICGGTDLRPDIVKAFAENLGEGFCEGLNLTEEQRKRLTTYNQGGET